MENPHAGRSLSTALPLVSLDLFEMAELEDQHESGLSPENLVLLPLQIRPQVVQRFQVCINISYSACRARNLHAILNASCLTGGSTDLPGQPVYTPHHILIGCLSLLQKPLRVWECMFEQLFPCRIRLAHVKLCFITL